MSVTNNFVVKGAVLLAASLVVGLSVPACSAGGGVASGGAEANTASVHNLTLTGKPNWSVGTINDVTLTVNADSGADTRVTWESSDDSVLKLVDQKNARVKAEGVGQATLTATSVQNPTKQAMLDVQVVVSQPIDLESLPVTNVGFEHLEVASDGRLVVGGVAGIRDGLIVASVNPDGTQRWVYKNDDMRMRDMTVTGQGHVVSVGDDTASIGHAIALVFERGVNPNNPRILKRYAEQQCAAPYPAYNSDFHAVAPLPDSGAVISGRASCPILVQLQPPNGNATEWTTSAPRKFTDNEDKNWRIPDVHAVEGSRVAVVMKEIGDETYPAAQQTWLVTPTSGATDQDVVSERGNLGDETKNNSGGVDDPAGVIIHGGVSANTVDEQPTLLAEALTRTDVEIRDDTRLGSAKSAEISFATLADDGTTSDRSTYKIQNHDKDAADETLIKDIAFADADTLIVAGNTKTQLGDNANNWSKDGTGFLLSLNTDGTRNWIKPLNGVVEMTLDPRGQVAVLTEADFDFDAFDSGSGDEVSFHPIAGPPEARN